MTTYYLSIYFRKFVAMEQYIVSARKYRPSTFASVVGQQALTSTLKNAIATDRLAHAYLFCGSRGVGKTSCARIIAKTIKGLGVSYMENAVGWHGKARNDEQYAQAMEDLEKVGEALCQK